MAAREAERVRLEEAATQQRDQLAEQAAQRAERAAAAAAKREAARLVEHEAASLRAAAKAAAAEEAAIAREAERVKAAALREEERRQKLEEIAAMEQERTTEIAALKAETATIAKTRLARHVQGYKGTSDGDRPDDAQYPSTTAAHADGEQSGIASETKLRDLERRLSQPPVRPLRCSAPSQSSCLNPLVLGSASGPPVPS